MYYKPAENRSERSNVILIMMNDFINGKKKSMVKTQSVIVSLPLLTTQRPSFHVCRPEVEQENASVAQVPTICVYDQNLAYAGFSAQILRVVYALVFHLFIKLKRHKKKRLLLKFLLYSFTTPPCLRHGFPAHRSSCLVSLQL